jgi:probable rRNA maturation factor
VPKIEIAVKVVDPMWRRIWPEAVSRSRSAARLALDTEWNRKGGDLAKPVEAVIVLSSDEDVRRLNRIYRGIDRPTNVLSFCGTGADGGDASEAPVMLGDVILACQTVLVEALTQGKTFPDHALHLVVHGVLHLLGHDHQTDSEADLMEATEIQVLARLGVANPYIAGAEPATTRRQARTLR